MIHLRVESKNQNKQKAETDPQIHGTDGCHKEGIRGGGMGKMGEGEEGRRR